MDIGEDDILDSLFGTPQITWVKDNKTRKIVHTYTSRNETYISKRSPYGNILSGIFLVRHYLNNDDKKIKWTGKWYPNLQATTPIKNEDKEVIFNSIFQNNK